MHINRKVLTVFTIASDFDYLLVDTFEIGSINKPISCQRSKPDVPISFLPCLKYNHSFK